MPIKSNGSDDLDELLKNDGQKFVYREEFRTAITMVNSRLDLLSKDISDLKSASQRQAEQLINIINQNNQNLQVQLASLISNTLQTKNNVVKEALKTKDKSVDAQYKLTSYVLKYELAKGGIAGLILSGVLIFLKVMGFL
jgi:hypothetical protein